MTRDALLRSRVKGNFQARFWNSGGRGDSPTDCRKLSEAGQAHEARNLLAEFQAETYLYWEYVTPPGAR